MQGKLIYDIGFHKCEDIGYYLHRGCKVVGCDADPAMVERARKVFSKEIASGQLTVFNYAIADKDNETVPFNVSEWSLWSSLRTEVAGRDQKQMKTVQVPTRRLGSIMEECGVPYYCKIDIEGYDAVAVGTLNEQLCPEFISVETECIGDSEQISDEQALETLNRLMERGYTRFKLVDQRTMEILRLEPFYGKPKEAPHYKPRTLMDKLLRRPPVVLRTESNFDRIRKKFGYDFPPSASGPFGNDLDGEWIDYNTGRELLLYHRKAFFAQQGVSNYSFWCDWHATK